MEVIQTTRHSPSTYNSKRGILLYNFIWEGKMHRWSHSYLFPSCREIMYSNKWFGILLNTKCIVPLNFKYILHRSILPSMQVFLNTVSRLKWIDASAIWTDWRGLCNKIAKLVKAKFQKKKLLTVKLLKVVELFMYLNTYYYSWSKKQNDLGN